MNQQIGFCTTADDVRLCYATFGQGTSLVKAPNWLSHLEFEWQSPIWRHWWRDLGRDFQVVRFDQRGCGLSDWNVDAISFKAWVNDLETVVDHIGLERFALMGISQGGAVAIEYAVRHPERVSHLVLCGAYARGAAKRGPAALEEREALLTLTKQGWGRNNPAYRQVFTSRFIPGASAEQMDWFNELQRTSTSLENATRIMTAYGDIDVLDRLAHVAAPTLVLHASEDVVSPVEEGRTLASLIPNARFVTLDSANHLPLEDEPAWQQLLSEVRLFLGTEGDDGSDPPPPSAVEVERPGLRLHAAPYGTVTVMFTDIEGSTAMTERLGDQRAQDVLRTHNAIVREQVAAHDGFEVKSQGDGFMVAFSSARLALECAIRIQQSVASHNAENRDEPIRVRIGLHTGEAVREDEDFFGKNVILAARIASEARGEQILVSSLLKALVESSGEFQFGEAREVELKGLAGVHQVFEVKLP